MQARLSQLEAKIDRHHLHKARDRAWERRRQGLAVVEQAMGKAAELSRERERERAAAHQAACALQEAALRSGVVAPSASGCNARL